MELSNWERRMLLVLRGESNSVGIDRAIAMMAQEKLTQAIEHAHVRPAERATPGMRPGTHR